MQLLQQVAYRAQIQLSESSNYRLHDSPNADLLLSNEKEQREICGVFLPALPMYQESVTLAIFHIHQKWLGKWYKKFELTNAFDFFKPNALQLIRSTYEQNHSIGVIFTFLEYQE